MIKIMTQRTILLLIIIFIFANCNNYLLKHGIYKSDYGKLKLNKDNTFDYYYHVTFWESFSSGNFSATNKKIILKSGSMNSSRLTHIVPKNNMALGKDKYEFSLFDEGFSGEEDSSLIKYYLILNDSIVHQVIGNYLIIKGGFEINNLKIRIEYNDSSSYISYLNKSLTTDKYIVTEKDKNSYGISFNVHLRMFNVKIFNDTFKIYKGSILFPKKDTLNFCPKCIWENEKMNSPGKL